MTSTNLPSDFVPNFSNERLTIIANALLEQCYETDDDLQSKYDSNYSLGCTRFDRQKNRLIEMPFEYDWINTVDSSNRLVMSILGAPFRFTNDDHIVPKKKASLAISETEQAQMSKFSDDPNQILIPLEYYETEVNFPSKWRFFIDIIESSEIEDREYEIYFVGLNQIDQPCCIWKHSEHVSSYIYSVDDHKAEKVKTNPARITLPDNQVERKNK